MPLDSLAHLGTHLLSLSVAIKLALVATVIFCIRAWAKGYAYKASEDERKLADKTWLLLDCLEGPGLVLAAHLASNKAQVVLLTPDPPEASVATQQLVSLIRASSRNERVYAEHCDVSDAAEVKAFAKRWTEQTAAGGGHAGALGDMALRLDAIVLGCTDSRALKEPGYVRGQRLTFLREMMPALLRAGQSAPARALVAIPPLYAAIPPDDKAKDDPSVLARTAVASRTLVKELHALRTTLVGAYNSRASHASDVRVEAVSLGYSRTFVLGALSASLSREGRLPLASVARWLILAFALPPVWLLAKSDVEAAQQLIARAMAKATFAPNSEAAASGEATPATSVPQDVPTVWREGREMPLEPPTPTSTAGHEDRKRD